jgi:hypothetical protein
VRNGESEVRAGGEESVKVRRRGRQWPLPAARELEEEWLGFRERSERGEKARHREGEEASEG